MPAKWQLWMPLYIDRFLGSVDVQMMEPAAFKGYVCLLLAAWQTEDCSLPADDGDLAKYSRLGRKAWLKSKAEILPKFSTVTGSVTAKVRNEVEFELWVEARRVFEARQGSAKRTNDARSPKKEDTVTVDLRGRSADTQTPTLTYTSTEVQEAPPAREAPPPAGSNGEFMAATHIWQELGIAAGPYDVQMLAQTIGFEATKAQASVESTFDFLLQAAQAAIKRGETVNAFWFKDRKFTQENGDGSHHAKGTGKRISPAKERVDGNRRAIAEALAARGVDGPWNSPRTDSAAVSQPRPERNVTRVPD